MSSPTSDDRPRVSLPQRVLGVLAGLFWGGFALCLVCYPFAAILAGAPASAKQWWMALTGVLMILVLMAGLIGGSKNARRHQRSLGLLFCLIFTILAIMLDYQLFAPETKVTTSVGFYGFARSFTTNVAQVSSHGIQAHVFAIVCNSIVLVLWYAWLRRVPGWFGERKRPRR